jgi:8-oxo-dGTP pyrophosphatase MutT (NUDIX family)
MELQVGVKVILQNSEEKYLAIFRSLASSTKFGQCWDIPGGRIESGSFLMENLKREVMEETGLEIKGEPKLLEAQDIFKKEKGIHVVRLTYVGYADGDVVLSDEHVEYRWVTLEEFRNLEPIDGYIAKVLNKI